MTEPQKKGLFGRLFGGAEAKKPQTVEEAKAEAKAEAAAESLAPEPEVLREADEAELAAIIKEQALAQEPLPVAVAEQIAVPALEAVPEPEPEAPRLSFFQRLRKGLAKTSSRLTDGISSVFTKSKLDNTTLEELEDLLIQADLGLKVSADITATLRKTRYDTDITAEEVRDILASEIEKILAPVAHPLTFEFSHRPHVVLMVGVNGTGKTTTIGKYARQLADEGRKVMLCAGDTFRAAAIEQLKVWGERTGAAVISREPGADAAGLAYDAYQQAQDEGYDVLLIDTAGRLQNKAALMAELEKVVRVIKKFNPDAPHTVLLTLDATTGQNALNQVEIFGKTAGVTGLIMTKLDGTARGGILVAIANQYGLPVHAIGVGEGADDLQAFDARDFARAIAGVAS